MQIKNLWLVGCALVAVHGKADTVSGPRWNWEKTFTGEEAQRVFAKALKKIPVDQQDKAVDGEAMVLCTKTKPYTCTIRARGEVKEQGGSEDKKDKAIQWKVELDLDDEESKQMYEETLKGYPERKTPPPQKYVKATVMIVCSEFVAKKDYRCLVDLEDYTEPREQ